MVYITRREQFSAAHKLLTKGDNNDVDDTMLYPPDRPFLDRDDVKGVVRGYIPIVGYFAVAFSDHPWLRLVLFGIGVLTVVFQRERGK